MTEDTESRRKPLNRAERRAAEQLPHDSIRFELNDDGDGYMATVLMWDADDLTKSHGLDPSLEFNLSFSELDAHIEELQRIKAHRDRQLEQVGLHEDVLQRAVRKVTAYLNGREQQVGEPGYSVSGHGETASCCYTWHLRVGPDEFRLNARAHLDIGKSPNLSWHATLSVPEPPNPGKYVPLRTVAQSPGEYPTAIGAVCSMLDRHYGAIPYWKVLGLPYFLQAPTDS